MVFTQGAKITNAAQNAVFNPNPSVASQWNFTNTSAFPRPGSGGRGVLHRFIY
jgi:hypothetical protein